MEGWENIGVWNWMGELNWHKKWPKAVFIVSKENITSTVKTQDVNSSQSSLSFYFDDLVLFFNYLTGFTHPSSLCLSFLPWLPGSLVLSFIFNCGNLFWDLFFWYNYIIFLFHFLLISLALIIFPLSCL